MKRYLWSAICLTLIVACSPLPEIVPSPTAIVPTVTSPTWTTTPATIPTLTPTSIPTASPARTQTPVPTATPTLIPTITQIPSPTPTGIGGGAGAILFFYCDGPVGQCNNGKGLFMRSDGTLTHENFLPFPNRGFISPDGNKWAFARDGNLYTANLDGTGQVQLTTGDLRLFGWSPDGEKVLLYDDKILQIFLINADGTGLVQLTNSAERNFSPTLSPDGTKIAFERGDFTAHIYVMNADGTNQVQITKGPVSTQYPVWSPDGKKIAFNYMAPANERIGVVNVNGTGQMALTEDLSMFPVWISNDRIRFQRTLPSERPIGISTINANGQRRIDGPNDTELSHLLPWSWSPDQTKIAYPADCTSAMICHAIFIANADGTDPTKIAGSPDHRYYFYAWIP